MSKEHEYKPGLLDAVIATCLVGILASHMWESYSPALETHGSQRLTVIGKRLEWRFAFGPKDLIEKVAPWIIDEQVEKTTIGELEVAGGLVIDERLNIRDRRFVQTATR